jgi:hypothetical protein
MDRVEIDKNGAATTGEGDVQPQRSRQMVHQCQAREERRAQR